MLPYVCLQCRQCLFASRHSSLYHGAKFFSHLFGFLLAVIVFFVMTSALTASAMRYSSIFSALQSLSSANSVSMSSKSFKNCMVAV